MKSIIRRIALLVAGAAMWIGGPSAFGQVVINEIVHDERQADSTQIPDTREFIELYNSGNAAVNIGDWVMKYWQLGTTAGGGSYFATSDTIPTGTSLASHAYYVIGATGVPHVNLDLGTSDLFPDTNTIFELRNPANVLVDALGVQTFRNVELANATQEQLDQIAAGQTASPTARGGFWGQDISNDNVSPNVPQSIGRFRDGVDRNVNGRDFGMLPITPGASNNLPQNASHTIPNVDAIAVGTELGTAYHASFVLPRVINPTVVGPVGASGNNINPIAIPASPQGGRAIIAYDETGGGNAAYSRELVNKFSLYAYIDTADLNLGQTAVQYEQSTYGIGTTDPFFGSTNEAGLNTLTSTQNGNTGIGWHIQRAEAANGGATKTLLELIDFNDGGDSVQSVNDWQVKQTIDLSAAASGWHFLSVDYDPTTGNVVAKYDTQTFSFSTITDLAGTFYVGYRENLPGTGNTVARPPTYDLFVPTALAGDYNGDGKVDAADYVMWRKNPAGFGGNPAGYTAWRNSFGLPGSGLGAGPVPEPCGAIVAFIGLAVCGAMRRKR